MMYFKCGIFQKITAMMLFVSLLLASSISVFAEGTASGSPVSLTVESTQSNVEAVRDLASGLSSANPAGKRTGGFTWDTEGKSRSWTYYNGIMMDAFLMLDSEAYTSYVDSFYNANISAAGNVDNTGASDNYYRVKELDSIPPTRALFDLIRGGSAQSAKYKKMIDYVYSVMQNFTVVNGTGGNFIHKMDNSSWSTYQVALDGLYMAQPFFMEIANALDDGTLSSSDFQTYSRTTLNADTLYSAVCSRMKWIGANLYDSGKGLYDHGWGPQAGVNGQFWLRAIGWYAAALADVIDMLPERYASERAELTAIAQRLFDGMMEYQDEETGLWYNVVNYDSSLTSGSGNRLETSGSALMAYSMMRLYDKGYVGDEYGEAGLRAFNGIVSGFVDEQGLHNVYISSGVETTPAGYLTKSYKTNEAKGVGPLIMASCYANAAAEKLNAEGNPFHYTGDGGTITASRGDDSEDLTLTISAPEDLIYDGTSKEATLNDYDQTAFPGEYSIVYTQDGTVLDSAPVNAGTYTASVTVGEGEDAVTAGVEYTIRPREVTISGITAGDKTYDGNTDAAIDTGNALFRDIINGDTLSVTATGTFRDANAGEDKTVTIRNLRLGGDSAGNYILAETGQQTETTASITPRSITGAVVTLDEVSYPYSGSEQSVSVISVETDSFSLEGTDYEVTGNTGSDAAAYTVTVTGKGNYKDTATAEWNITKMALTVKAVDQTIREGESIAGTPSQVVIADGTLAEGQTISSVKLTAEGSEIVPSEAVITDDSDTDVTQNYEINYRNGVLTVISKVSRTVTFKVVNGFWNDGMAEDKPVTLSGYEGDELTLSANDIPAVGANPSENYQAGSWDVTPSAGTVITEDTTYIYTYSPVEAPAHEHSYSEEWSYDSATHWHACTGDGDCDTPRADEAEHSYGTEGEARYTCTDCGYVDPEKKAAAEQADNPDQPVTPSDVHAITITGLNDSDTVKLYQVIGWESGRSWTLLEPFTGIEPWASALAAYEEIQIDNDIVNTINTKITAETEAVVTDTQHPTDGTYTVSGLDPGLYIAIVTAGMTDHPDGSGKPDTTATIYNPIIVSANYFSETSVDAATSGIPIARPDAYGGNTVIAKKETISLEKKAKDKVTHDGNDEQTVAVGDEITFTVNTVIPPFAAYLHPSFVITDAMSEGLKYTKGSVSVTKPAGLTKGTEYEVTNESDTGTCGYTLSFKDTYLKSIAANTPVEITYQATVATDAVKSVNHEVNTVTLEFSINPHDDSTKGKLKDRTNHYTFDIDANLAGHPEYGATEIVKVGVDANGNEIQKSTTLSNTGQVGALQGAEFALYKAKLKEGSEEEWEKEWETPVIEKISSGPDGRLLMTGLDAGKYLLIETKAPDGYIKDNDPVKIEIEANVLPKTYVEDGCTIETDELVSYTVTVNGAQTASYTIQNSPDPDATSANEGDVVVGIDGDKGKIKNTQGTELPSTGGPGTNLIYLLGIMLAGLAGSILILERVYCPGGDGD